MNVRRLGLVSFARVLALLLSFTFALAAYASEQQIVAPILQSSDDAEQASQGDRRTVIDSDDLELGRVGVLSQGRNQVVALRFAQLPIPAGSLISSAAVQFTAERLSSEDTQLQIFAELTENATTFSSAVGNIDSRLQTANSVIWSPPPWTQLNNTGPEQLTPDLALLLQEVVSQPGWRSGNAVVLLFSGTGSRSAFSFDAMPELAPTLHIDFHRDPNYDAPPMASLAVDLEVGAFPHSVVFDASGAIDDNGIVSYEWDFDDGTGVQVTTEAQINHTYSQADIYLATVTVVDTAGQSDTAAAAVFVDTPDLAPAAVITSNTDTGVSPAVFTFSAQGSTDDFAISFYLWDFGDGSQPIDTAGSTVSHNYTAPGAYEASVFVFDDAGQFGVATTRIVVAANDSDSAPTAVLEILADESLPANTVFFDASSSTDDFGISFYVWEFPDSIEPTVTTTPQVQYTFRESGVYPIYLTVVDTIGQTDLFFVELEVEVSPSEPDPQIPASHDCIDSDGDGYGWDGQATCVPSMADNGTTDEPTGSNSQTAVCSDFDGDGYGWNGVETCLINQLVPNDPPIFTDMQYVGVPCIDTDGDGWGWQEPLDRAIPGRSCIVDD